MRCLALAKFRLLTTIRSATPIFVLVAVPPLIGAALQSMPEPLFRDSAAALLDTNAHTALLAWFSHMVLICIACQAFGNLKSILTNPTLEVPDLMDSVPVGKRTRFWGEALGVFAAALTVHAAALPLLAAAALLSPLPLTWFAVLECLTIFLLILASAAAAWKRLAPRNKWSATRTPRAAIVFLILLAAIIGTTTDGPLLRNSFGAFVDSPSMAGWAAVRAAVHNPVLLAVLTALLLGAYVLFFFNSASKTAEA